MAAPKTLYLTNTVTDNFQQLSETSPGADATTSPNVGWTVGTSATNTFPLDSGTESTTTGSPTDGSIDATAGDCFRFGPFSGSFASANWTFTFALIAVTSATGQDGTIRCRLHRSANSNGSSPTQLLAEQTSTQITNLPTSQTTCTVTANPGAFTLDNEYLFIEVGWVCTGGASMTNADVIFRIGTTATRIVTSNFNLTVQKAETITVTESTTRLLITPGLARSVNEASTVTESAKAVVSPVAVHASEAVTVSESARVAVTPLLVYESDAVAVTELRRVGVNLGARLRDVKIVGSFDGPG